MAGEDDLEKERTLEYTATWSVAVVCFVLIAISILIEHIIHMLEKYLKRKRKVALAEAVEKVKSELMLLGFISLLLTVFQSSISDICIPRKVAETWRPCSSTSKSKKDTEKYGRRLLEFWDGGGIARRSLATKGYDKCTEKDELAFVTAYGIHELHIFIFVLAIFHVLYCITTLALGKLKMRAWNVWENEIKTQEYRQFNDPAKFRFTKETSFGKRHLNFWSRTRISLYLVCFFRQFSGSITKVDYLTLRHGFIATHFPSGNETRFDFQQHIHKSLEEDFKVIVGISPVIWLIAVIFLLPNVDGSYAHMWLPFVSLFIVLLVGTKLQVIITRMGLRIQEREHVVKGAPVVQLSDDLFWFGKPRLILFLVHFVLFQNAFQLAFFAWSWYEFGFRNCFHKTLADIIIRVSMGIIIHILCSYVTLPLFALVTQMGSTLKTTIFNEHVTTALKDWHHRAKKHAKHSKHPGSAQPESSRPVPSGPGETPSVHHLLNEYQNRSNDSIHLHPDASETTQWEDLDIQSSHDNGRRNGEGANQPTNSIHLPSAPPARHSHDEIDISLTERSSGK